MISCLQLPHPQRETGSLGVGAMGRLPQGGTTSHQPSFLGHQATLLAASPPEQSPARPLGLADPSSIPPGLGESPRPDSLSHPCHFSSAALFPLSASYTLQRLHRKAWLPLRPLPRPLLGPRCPAGRGCLHNRVPLGPVPESRPTAWVVECTVCGRALFVIPWFLVFGVEGPRLWAHAPLLSR